MKFTDAYSSNDDDCGGITYSLVYQSGSISPTPFVLGPRDGADYTIAPIPGTDPFD